MSTWPEQNRDRSKPLADRHHRNSKRAGDLTRRLTRLPSDNNQRSHLRRGFGILVNVHGPSPEDRVASQTPQSTVLAREQPIETLQLGYRITGDRTVQSNSRVVGWVEPSSAIGPRTMARVHICIDDASRIADADIYTDDTDGKPISTIACLYRSVAYYQSLGITVRCVMPPVGD